MKPIAELPHLAAICRDGSSWILPIDAPEDFEAHWMAGKAFWTGRSARGSRVTVKLADITGTAEYTEVVLVQIQAERDEEQRRKMLAGGE